MRADSRLVASQWEMLLQSNATSHCLGANLESALIMMHGKASSHHSKNISKIINSRKALEEIMLRLEAITVSADGPAPFSARPSAGTVMTKFRFFIYM